jgi:hypothetical protein
MFTAASHRGALLGEALPAHPALELREFLPEVEEMKALLRGTFRSGRNSRAPSRPETPDYYRAVMGRPGGEQCQRAPDVGIDVPDGADLQSSHTIPRIIVVPMPTETPCTSAALPQIEQ